MSGLIFMKFVVDSIIHAGNMLLYLDFLCFAILYISFSDQWRKFPEYVLWDEISTVKCVCETFEKVSELKQRSVKYHVKCVRLKWRLLMVEFKFDFSLPHIFGPVKSNKHEHSGLYSKMFAFITHSLIEYKMWIWR